MTKETLKALDKVCVQLKCLAMRLEPDWNEDRNALIKAVLDLQEQIEAELGELERCHCPDCR